MLLLNWPSKFDCKGKPVDYEWAYLKAALEGKHNGDTYKTYVSMFGESPKAEVPYWLVRLAIYYGALKIGYDRCKKSFKGIEQEMFACVQKLDEEKLRNNARLWHYMYLHDVEPAEYCGREKVSI